jgi:hypothetical protein
LGTHADYGLCSSGSFRDGRVPKDAAAGHRVKGQRTVAVCHGIGADGVAQFGREEEVRRVSGHQEAAMTRARAGYGIEWSGLCEIAGGGVNGEYADEISS